MVYTPCSTLSPTKRTSFARIRSLTRYWSFISFFFFCRHRLVWPIRLRLRLRFFIHSDYHSLSNSSTSAFKFSAKVAIFIEPLSPSPCFLTETSPFSASFFTNNEQIRDSFQFVIANLPPYLFIPVIDKCPNILLGQFANNLLCIVVKFSAYRQNSHLIGSKPQREFFRPYAR